MTTKIVPHVATRYPANPLNDTPININEYFIALQLASASFFFFSASSSVLLDAFSEVFELPESDCAEVSVCFFSSSSLNPPPLTDPKIFV